MTDDLKILQAMTDPNAEAALLGCCCLDERAWIESAPIVRREMFADDSHRLMFDAIAEMYARSVPVDAVTLKAAMVRNGTFDQAGGLAALASVLGAVPSGWASGHYAATVADLWRRRELHRIAYRAFDDARNGTGETGQEMIARVMDTLAKLNLAKEASATKLETALHATIAALEAGGSPLIPTGFRALDDAVGGFGIGETFLVGGRPSMGKSTAIEQMALRNAVAGIPVAIVTLEESTAKISRNVLSSETGIDNNRMRRNASLSEIEWNEINSAVSRLSAVPLWIVENVRSLRAIHAELALLKAKHDIRAVYVDYLQLVQAGGKDSYERASLSSVGLVQMFKSLGVAGIVAAQLNREAGKGEGRRPTMTDLRDSGQIEQDADGILLLHREDYYHLDDANWTPSGIAEIIIAKMRDGCRGGVVHLKSRLHNQTFDDADQTVDPFDSPPIPARNGNHRKDIW